MRGRAYVIPDDAKYMAPFVLEHRIIAQARTHLRGRTTGEILTEVLDSVPVPVEQTAATG
jgi:MoxR-like ATPase